MRGPLAGDLGLPQSQGLLRRSAAYTLHAQAVANSLY